ncbi:MAG: hypothetical protein K9I69_02935 [Ignavibacteriales bacterium]|nr:hypothetical protein [Ignavibacteriales bacterium]MCF8306538.1 hypothetical protein [Ignavibacteriales bacterium]MCF8316337.1 hypothetical protein [Ignavibacteriales bacterium]MCF8437705.1 hypothetical protein [Ignavibacteriales bacterium]
MKKYLIPAGILTFFLVMLLFSSVRDEIYWSWSKIRDGKSNYRGYLENFPNGNHSVQARKIYDQLLWREAEVSSSVEGYSEYLKESPGKFYASKAYYRIDSISFDIASSANNILALIVYREQFPEGFYTQEAFDLQKKLADDETIFTNQIKDGTAEEIEKFLEDFPGHKMVAAALEAKKDLNGKDIVDLIKEKKIQVKVKGSGIQNMDISIKRLVPYPLKVRVPVGTYFEAGSSSTQNMVSTGETITTLTTDDWINISPSAACANRPRDIPTDDDRFSVRRSPHQAELARLMPVLERETRSYPVKQAAVWIITDNASYNDLGILVDSPYGYGGNRAIDEDDAARAMVICSKAGIDIKGKRIWSDRGEILHGIEDAEIKDSFRKL